MINKANTQLNITSIYKIKQIKHNLSKIKIIDSTPLEVCKIQREKRHKTCKSISTKSYNGIYLFYLYYLYFVYKMLMSGVSVLKLHILIEPNGSIIDARIATAASINDSKLHSIFIPKYPNSIYIADKGYLSKDNRVLSALYSSSIFTPIRKNMTSKELTKIELKSYFYFTKVNRWLFVSLYKMFVHVSGEIRYLSCD